MRFDRVSLRVLWLLSQHALVVVTEGRKPLGSHQAYGRTVKDLEKLFEAGLATWTIEQLYDGNDPYNAIGRGFTYRITPEGRELLDALRRKADPPEAGRDNYWDFLEAAFRERDPE